MNNKLLVVVSVPLIEKDYDMYIPIVKKIGTIKQLIVNYVVENSEGEFTDTGCLNLYDKSTGELLNDNEFVKNSGIKNGTRLLLV